MFRKVIVAGLLGGLVLFGWTFVINGLFGFRNSLDMNQIPAEREVYEILRESIVKPGRYVCNPELTSLGTFPDGEPVFSIHFSGMGHESAGRLMVFQLALFFVAPTIGAWTLSVSSARILASYHRRVLFFAAVGLLLATYGVLQNFGIDGYSLGDTLMLAGRDVISWTLVGLAVAWGIQPESSPVMRSQAARA
jgi:hypothetical protein